jgi:hypothetical protein
MIKIKKKFRIRVYWFLFIKTNIKQAMSGEKTKNNNIQERKV